MPSPSCGAERGGGGVERSAIGPALAQQGSTQGFVCLVAVVIIHGLGADGFDLHQPITVVGQLTAFHRTAIAKKGSWQLWIASTHPLARRRA